MSTTRTERLRRQAVTTPLPLQPSCGRCLGLTTRASNPFTTASLSAMFGQSCTTPVVEVAAKGRRRRRRLGRCVHQRNRVVQMMSSSSSSSAEKWAGTGKAREVPPSSSAGLVPQVSVKDFVHRQPKKSFSKQKRTHKVPISRGS